MRLFLSLSFVAAVALVVNIVFFCFSPCVVESSLLSRLCQLLAPGALFSRPEVGHGNVLVWVTVDAAREVKFVWRKKREEGK